MKTHRLLLFLPVRYGNTGQICAVTKRFLSEYPKYFEIVTSVNASQYRKAHAPKSLTLSGDVPAAWNHTYKGISYIRKLI